MSDTSPEEPDPRGHREAQVDSLDDLAVKYDFTAPDTFVGPESSRFVLDYGGPSVIADSRTEAFQLRAERLMWERYKPDEDTKPSSWERLRAGLRHHVRRAA